MTRSMRGDPQSDSPIDVSTVSVDNGTGNDVDDAASYSSTSSSYTVTFAKMAEGAYSARSSK